MALKVVTAYIGDNLKAEALVYPSAKEIQYCFDDSDRRVYKMHGNLRLFIATYDQIGISVDNSFLQMYDRVLVHQALIQMKLRKVFVERGAGK